MHGLGPAIPGRDVVAFTEHRSLIPPHESPERGGAGTEAPDPNHDAEQAVSTRSAWGSRSSGHLAAAVSRAGVSGSEAMAGHAGGRCRPDPPVSFCGSTPRFAGIRNVDRTLALQPMTGSTSRTRACQPDNRAHGPVRRAGRSQLPDARARISSYSARVSGSVSTPSSRCRTSCRPGPDEDHCPVVRTRRTHS